MPPAISLKIDARSLAIMQSVDAFERSDAADEVDLRNFLGNAAPEHRLDVLAELVRVDLERRSRRKQRRALAEYLDLYPELRQSKQSVIDLLQAEFELELESGKSPDVADYRRIDPDFRPPAAVDTARTAQPTLPFGDDVCLAPVPERVGRYAIVRELGAGGFGVVYQAYDEQLERMVAIKIRHSGRAGLSDDLLHEARSIAQLDHPGIVRLLDADQTPQGLGYVVYEYIDGETLCAALARKDFDRAQAVEWVAQVAEALHYAHRHKIVHRDIKPANILLDSDRRPKLVDFGLARRDDKFFRKDAGQVVGTLAYLSPEQAAGDSHWSSSQSDLYSLGVVLYELLCHKRPFSGGSTAEVLDEVLHRSPPPPRSIDDTIPVALEDACLKALAKRPTERFRTGGDMASAVRSALRPKQSRLPSLARYAAAAAAVAALCVLANALRTPAATAPAAARPEISSYNLLFADTETPVNDRLPLTSQDRLKVEATFTSPAYGYLLVFDQQAQGRLVWPPADDLSRQAPVSRLTYPPLEGDVAGLSAPDVDGAMFVVALATQEPLSRQTIDELLSTPWSLNVEPEITAQAQTCFQVAEPAPKFHQPIPTRGGKRATDLRFPDNFRRLLKEHSDMFVGNIVPHVKSADPPAN